MDYKKIKTDSTTITRDLNQFIDKTGNLYESIVILAKRANQISTELKEELNSKLEEFATHNDNLEEVFENREQIEIAKYYEQLPKPSLISIHEFQNDNIYFRKPSEDDLEDEL